MKPCRSTLSLVAVLALALGAAAFGCGPQKKFCPGTPGDKSDGVCATPVDSAVEDVGKDAPVEMGSITVDDKDGSSN